MRAWQTVKPGRPMDALSLNEDAAPPQPYPGTVQLEVVAAGVGLPDVFMCQGTYHLTPSTLPFTQGQEVVGRVIGWGEGVEGRQLGDRVMAVTSFFTGNGGYAQQCLGLDDFCLPVPDGMTDAESSGFLIPFHTAHLALVQRGKVEPGETLLVIGGAGGTGQAAMQIGKALGARVIATAGVVVRAVVDTAAPRAKVIVVCGNNDVALRLLRSRHVPHDVRATDAPSGVGERESRDISVTKLLEAKAFETRHDVTARHPVPLRADGTSLHGVRRQRRHIRQHAINVDLDLLTVKIVLGASGKENYDKRNPQK